MRLEPFTGKIGSKGHLAWMELSRALNKKASAKFARRQFRIGRPVPKSWEDRAPDPGTYEGDAEPEG